MSVCGQTMKSLMFMLLVKVCDFVWCKNLFVKNKVVINLGMWPLQAWQAKHTCKFATNAKKCLTSY